MLTSRTGMAHWAIFLLHVNHACKADKPLDTLFTSSRRLCLLSRSSTHVERGAIQCITLVYIIAGGMSAGLLGIGGGMIVNPLLLEFNIHPQAAAATSTLMVLFSSSSAALSFGFGHQLNLHFALIFGLCCMGASLVGVLLVQRIVNHSGKVRPHF